MLHIKFCENRPAGSGEEDFLRFFFSIYGRGGHLGHVTHMPQTKFRSPYPRRIHIKKFLALIGQAVSEKKMSEHCGRQRTDAGALVYYKLPYEPLAQVC